MKLKQGYIPNEVYKVEQFGNTFKLIDTQGVTKLVLWVPQLVLQIGRTLSNKVKALQGLHH